MQVGQCVVRLVILHNSHHMHYLPIDNMITDQLLTYQWILQSAVQLFATAMTLDKWQKEVPERFVVADVAHD